MESFFKRLDYLAIKPKLFVKSQESYQTIGGGILGIFVGLIMLAFSGYFLNILFQRKEMSVEFNSSTQEVTELRLDEIFFNFYLASSQRVPVSSRISYPIVNHYQFLSNGSLIVETAGLDICTDEDYGENKELFAASGGYGEMFCLKKEFIKKKKLSGFFKNMVKGYTTTILYFVPCQNNSIYNPHPGQCATQVEIDLNLANKAPWLYFNIIDNEIKISDINTPFTKVLTSIQMLLTPQARYLHYIGITNISLISDYGLVFEEKHVDYSFKAIQGDSNIYLNNNMTIPEAFGAFALYKTLDSFIYYRRFLKLQNTIANIGGVVKAIMLMAQIFYENMATKLFFTFVANEIFYKNIKSEMKKDLNSTQNVFISKNITNELS
jgi:hypothetical protein